MSDLKNSETLKNLMRAFAGESQARNRYTFAAGLCRQQKLHVYFERAGRKGKTVTLVEGFVGKEADLAALEKKLKAKCGCGGSSKDGVILIQGDHVAKIKEFLTKEGYKVC